MRLNNRSRLWYNASDQAREVIMQNQVFFNHPRDKGSSADDDRPSFDFIDVLAFIIAAYQLLIPFILAFGLVVFLLYLFLRWWAA